MKSKIIRNSLLALTLAFAIGPTQAALDYSRSSARSGNAFQVEIDRLIQAQNLRENFIKSFKTMLGQLVAQGQISSAQLNAIAEEVADVIYPKIKEATAQCLRQNLTVDDLRQINAFYETPAGKKMVALTPTFTEAGAKAMQKPDVQAQVQRIVQKHLAK